MSMDVKEQETTYNGFIKVAVRSTVAIVAVLVLMKIFLA
ncbi:MULTISPECIES: aa3-type cytochrome c oxidase subunit IV [Kordiimonadales]|uniref:Aa3-type cytochrome c oxidase subunit IV n=1 Tax=Gimibacter soli TaxID=3024400 RepID=A0AAE9XUN9_9PROT|nr:MULTISPECIES: aa3-type cytochrome c oxidase subunit IV [Kordiimonadales]WCL53094.1 aa3-type cytochrome c oxidase subunit IV [Gimibacter soli]